MSKKVEIITMLKSGKTIEEIVNKGYSKKYVARINREMKVKEQNEQQTTCCKAEDKEIDLNTLKELMKEVGYVKKLLHETAVQKEEKLQTQVLNNLFEIESFVRSLKENYKAIKDIQVKFMITWGNEQKATEESVDKVDYKEALLQCYKEYKES